MDQISFIAMTNKTIFKRKTEKLLNHFVKQKSRASFKILRYSPIANRRGSAQNS